MSDALLVLSIVTALGAGVVAGVFFAFSNFAMAGLARIPPAEGIRAMQQINITVINPGFMTALFGTGLTCLAVIAVTLSDWDASHGWYLLAAALVYVVGSVGVTMAFNVPRNTVLARQEPTSAEAARVWERYLVEWTAWNSVRTAASLATTAGLIGGIAAA
jgi:uncharacterized membrane protein